MMENNKLSDVVITIKLDGELVAYLKGFSDCLEFIGSKLEDKDS